MARPTLPRYVAALTLYVDLGAEDEEHAAERLAALAEDVAPRLRATVRAHRAGRPVVDSIALGPVTALTTATS